MTDRQLKVVILGDASSGQAAIKKTEDSLAKLDPAGKVAKNALDAVTSSLTSRLGPASGEAKKALDGIAGGAITSGNLLGTAVAGGAAVAATALAGMAAKGISSFVELTAQVRALQRVSGASAEDASKLSSAMRTLGIDTDTGGRAFFQLSKAIENTPQKLAAVGIEVARNKDGSVNLAETLLNVSDAYNKTGDQAQRNAIAFAAFGKSGAALEPILARGRAGLRDLFAEADKHHEIFSQADLEKGRQFSLAMHSLGEAVGGLERALGEGLVPVLTTMAHNAATVIDKVDNMTRSIGGLGGIVKTVVSGIPGIGLLATAFGHTKKTTDDLKSSGDDLAASQGDVASSLEESAAAADKEAKALDKVNQAQIAGVDAALGYQSANDGLQKSEQDLKDKQDALTQAIHDHGAKSAEAAAASRDFTDAQHSLEDSAVRVAHSLVDQATKQAEANGQTLTGQQQADLFKQKLLELANQIGGPVGAALAGLANQIHGVEGNHQVVVSANVDDALAKLALVKGSVGQLLAHQGGVPNVPIAFPQGGSTSVGILVNPLAGKSAPAAPAKRALGGPTVAGGVYMTEELGIPEIFRSDVGGEIFPLPRAQAVMAQAARSSGSQPQSMSIDYDALGKAVASALLAVGLGTMVFNDEVVAAATSQQFQRQHVAHA